MSRIPAERMRRSSYPYVSPVIARYADVDAFLHINNVAMAQYFEDARISLLRTLLEMQQMHMRDGRVLLARQSIDYLREGRYPGSLEVGVAITAVGRTSVTVGMGLFQDDVCIAISDAVLVRLDDQGPREWSSDERTVLSDPVWQPQASD
jgi:acyl-CoA thioester hydrolase